MDELVDIHVGEVVRQAPRRLVALMAGPEPDADFVSNGCGPKLRRSPIIGRVITALVPDLLHSWPIWVACHAHDYAYTLGGDWKDRRRADFFLARNVVTVIAETGRSLSAPRVFAVATLYWLGVRLGGWSAWNYGAGVQPASKGLRRVQTAVALPGAAARLAGQVLRS